MIIRPTLLLFLIFNLSFMVNGQNKINAGGAEPHWSAREANGYIYVNDGGIHQDLKLKIISKDNVSGRSPEAGYYLIAKSEEHMVQLIIKKTDECKCNIDMAGDEPFEYFAYMIIDGSLLEGCGNKK